MPVKFVDFDAETIYDGKVVIYKNFIEYSKRTHFFDELIKKIISEHKLKATDVFANSIRLFYKIDNNIIVVSEYKVVDKVRLASNIKSAFSLLEKINNV